MNKLTYGNGAVQEFGFDADSGWLESLTLDVNGDGDVADDDEVQFTYGRDQLGRIVREEVSNSDYIYKPLSGDDLVKYISTKINQYERVGGDEPAYDYNGNLTFDGTFSYDWDEENFLTKVRAGTTTAIVAEYEYDALGRRSQKAVTEGEATTRYLWGGATNYAEYSGSDVWQRVYVYGPGIDEPLMVKEADGTKHYVHRDGKNTVIAVSAGGVGNASVTNKFTMDAWGNDTDSDVSPFKFTSRRLDKETGNFYYRNRYYDPDTGRFMSNDPIGYGDGLNMYAYVGNDPVNYRDPMGLSRYWGSGEGDWGGDDTIDEIVTTAEPLACNYECRQRENRRWANEQARDAWNQMSTEAEIAIRAGIMADRLKFEKESEENMALCNGDIDRGYSTMDKAALAAYHHVINNGFDRSNGNEFGFSFSKDASGQYRNVSRLRQTTVGAGETKIYFGGSLTGGMHTHPTSGAGLCVGEGSQFLSGTVYATIVCNYTHAGGRHAWRTTQNPSDYANLSGKAGRYPGYVAYLMSGHVDNPQLRKWELGGGLQGLGTEISESVICEEGG